jgi:hypothetical protein
VFDNVFGACVHGRLADYAERILFRTVAYYTA